MDRRYHQDDRADERPLREGLCESAAALLARGGREWVVIHLPEGACAFLGRGEAVWQGSVTLAPERIVGAAGAGDAFAAGLLHGLHEGKAMAENLRLGVCVAAACLHHATTSGGILPLADCLALGDEAGRRKWPD